MITFLKVRCQMTWDEIGRTSLLQAQMLMAEYDEVDGNREVVKTLYNIVNKLFGKEDGKKPVSQKSSPRKPDEVMTVAVVVDELADALKQAGWTPPAA